MLPPVTRKSDLRKEGAGFASSRASQRVLTTGGARAAASRSDRRRPSALRRDARPDARSRRASPGCWLGVQRPGGRAPGARPPPRCRADGPRHAGARRLQGDPAPATPSPACPVVVLTASPSPDDVHRARTAGAATYLNKGCAHERVVEALVEARACAFGGAADTEREHQVAQP